jgi:hypothetical protein
MSVVGYEFLRQHLALRALPPARPALVKPVTRVEPTHGFLAIPRHVAPAGKDPVEHTLFALKHEGTNLQILAEALPKIGPAGLLAELRRIPTGGYIRLACYLWEHFAQGQLTDLPEIAGATVEVFDPKRFITGAPRRDARWRVAFNGLGSLAYCASVDRTAFIEQAMRSDILARAKAFAQSLGKGMLDRALAWAYLHETEDSFAIERETPSEDKARSFVALLHQAHEGRPLTENYLVELQNSALTNSFDRAAGYRTEQNWLRGPARGAAGVTYVPPPPSMVGELMDELTEFENGAPRELDPILAAAVASFGFVYIHPFMDGNGRLSRFIFHHALCRSGKLERGLILPVSVAMKRNEEEYLSVLQHYSRPARERWSVKWIDEGQYDLEFEGSPALYRYWDATPCVEFGFRMAEQALEVDLRQETAFLARYDRIVRAVDERFDVRGSDLATLVISCLDQGGRLSKRRRQQFAGRVPEAVFDYIEELSEGGDPDRSSGGVVPLA